MRVLKHKRLNTCMKQAKRTRLRTCARQGRKAHEAEHLCEIRGLRAQLDVRELHLRARSKCPVGCVRQTKLTRLNTRKKGDAHAAHL